MREVSGRVRDGASHTQHEGRIASRSEGVVPGGTLHPSRAQLSNGPQLSERQSEKKAPCEALRRLSHCFWRRRREGRQKLGPIQRSDCRLHHVEGRRTSPSFAHEGLGSGDAATALNGGLPLFAQMFWRAACRSPDSHVHSHSHDACAVMSAPEGAPCRSKKHRHPERATPATPARGAGPLRALQMYDLRRTASILSRSSSGTQRLYFRILNNFMLAALSTRKLQ